LTVRLTFVGSGDAFAGGGRFQTCFHLGADGTDPLLIDCGATTLIALKRMGIDPASIGHVALTHLHGDHFGGLPWLVLDGQFAKRAKTLTIAGPTGTTERVHQAFEALYPGAATAERRFETRFVEYEPRVPLDFGPARITAYPVRHTPATEPHGLRIEYAERLIAYSGDTEWTDTLPELARGADLFICECNFYDTKAPGHLDYETLMQHREELECDRIVLTHMSEAMLARTADLAFETASDGMTIDLAG
jgi:ribonuclease BN (tRNA processing enzyme)